MEYNKYIPAYREWDDDELKAGLHYFVNVEELRKRFPRVSVRFKTATLSSL